MHEQQKTQCVLPLG